MKDTYVNHEDLSCLVKYIPAMKNLSAENIEDVAQILNACLDGQEERISPNSPESAEQAV